MSFPGQPMGCFNPLMHPLGDAIINESWVYDLLAAPYGLTSISSLYLQVMFSIRW